MVNAGQPGHSSVQGLHYYRSDLSQYEADAITVCFGANDYGVSVLGYRTAGQRFRRGTNSLQKIRSVLLKSEIFVLFLKARERLNRRLQEARPYQFPPASELIGDPQDCTDSIAEGTVQRAHGGPGRGP